MVDIALFIVLALNNTVLQLGYTIEYEPLFYNYLRPLSILDERLYPLAFDEDVYCLTTLVRTFKLLKVYIEHGYTIVNAYQRPPLQVYASTHSSSCIEDPVCDSVTTRCMPHGMLTSPIDESVITYTQLSGLIEYVMRQLSFEETKLDGETGSGDVAGSGINCRQVPMSEILVPEVSNAYVVNESDTYVHVEPAVDVGRTEKHIVQHIRVDEVVDGSSEKVVVHASGEEDVEHGINDDDYDDYDDDFFVDEENDIVEPDVTMHLFGISKDEPFDNIGVTNLVLKDVLEGEDVDVVNLDGFYSDTCYDNKQVLTGGEGSRPTGPNQAMGVGPSGLSGPTTRSKKGRIYLRNIDPSLPTRVFKIIYVWLGAIKPMLTVCKRKLLGLDGAFRKGPFSGHALAVMGLDSNNGIYPFAYALVETEKFKKMNPKAHECLNKIPPEHWPRSYFLGRLLSDFLLNNICEVFNGKIVRSRDKPIITLLEYIREYCMKRIVNVQSVIDKCTRPLILSVTRMIKAFRKEAHVLNVQWNKGLRHQVSGSFGYQCVVDVVARTCSCKKWKLTKISCRGGIEWWWHLYGGDKGMRNEIFLHILCILDGFLDVLFKCVKLAKFLVYSIFNHGWLGLYTQPTPREVDRVEKVKALGVNGVMSGSRVMVLWMEDCGGVVSARVVSRVVIGLVMKVVLVMLRDWEAFARWF
uniref:Transposase, MuDR, MULE transposase domain protein n=1 Tax=Tanacetum cinerariifolium TaxID=118510 RepID=A0A6L2M077_TANCI|nr:hypothetical protein [Tanacetum cinerariifolium]